MYSPPEDQSALMIFDPLSYRTDQDHAQKNES